MANSRDTPGLKMAINPGMSGSYESLFHTVSLMEECPVYSIIINAIQERDVHGPFVDSITHKVPGKVV